MKKDFVIEIGQDSPDIRYWNKKALAGLMATWSLQNKHSGTCLIVGNGISQGDIPVDWINSHISFGLNYCHKREGFNPTYFLVGDVSVAVHEWPEACERHKNIPMFLPSPGMDAFGSEREVYRYIRMRRRGKPVSNEMDPTVGIAFTSVAHAATMIAVYMGYTKLLYIGLDGGNQMEHFYGMARPEDYNHLGNDVIVKAWGDGFAFLKERLPDIEMINLSTKTTITSLPRDDWQKH